MNSGSAFVCSLQRTRGTHSPLHALNLYLSIIKDNGVLACWGCPEFNAKFGSVAKGLKRVKKRRVEPCTNQQKGFRISHRFDFEASMLKGLIQTSTKKTASSTEEHIISRSKCPHLSAIYPRASTPPTSTPTHKRAR